MSAFLNALREEGTREEILEALGEALAECDFLRDQNTEFKEALSKICDEGSGWSVSVALDALIAERPQSHDSSSTPPSPAPP